MKNINSPSRIMALLGLSICVHGAVLWAISEKVSVTALPEVSSLMWSTEGSDDSATEAGVVAPVEIEVPEFTEPAKSTPVVAKTQDAKTEEVKTVKVKPIKKKAFVATELPQKEAISETKSFDNNTDALPKTTVADSNDPENLDPEIQTEPEVNLIPVKDAIAGVAPIEESDSKLEEQAPQQTEASVPSGQGSEAAEADQAMAAMGAGPSSTPVRSYQSLKQVAGNRPPQYPMQARRLGQQGQVSLRYFVTENGSVRDVNVDASSGSDLLDKEAVRAVSEYRFYPGQPGWTKHPVKFSLNGQQEAIPARLRTSGSSLND